MAKRVHVRFEAVETARYWGDRLTAIDPNSASTSAYPFLEEDEVIAKIRETNPLMPPKFVVPLESHVRVYYKQSYVGTYCGHSQVIEKLGLGHDQVRYRDGYAETYCPHSQSWEPVG